MKKTFLLKFNEIASDLLNLDSLIADSMKYSFFAGGKRIRPLLYLTTIDMLDEICYEDYVFSCALEMIHTYSLIHDDLPAMDNDDYRRGKLTNHKVFGEATAILAGDALLNRAYELLLNIQKDSRFYKPAQYLSNAVGACGMINGQMLDMNLENKQTYEDQVLELIKNKTSKLIAASIQGAALRSGKNIDLEEMSLALGLVFQLQDDLLDCESTFEEMGKTIGKDQKANKSTLLSLIGKDRVKKMIDYQLKFIYETIDKLSLDYNTSSFKSLIDLIANRQN